MGRLIDALGEGGLGEKECEDAISRLSGSFELSLDDTDYRMHRIARQVLFSGEAMTVEEASERIARIDASGINAICSRLLRGRARARFAYGELSKRGARASGLEGAKVTGFAGASSVLSKAGRRG